MEQRVAEVGESARRVLETIPEGVVVVAAAKTRTAAEVEAVIQAGILHIGHNYVQEAEAMIPQASSRAIWHMIGHLQRNKVARAVQLFDIVETVDSLRQAQELDKRCAALGKVMPMLIEVNSGREAGKTGVFPEEVDGLAGQIGDLTHVHLQGLMTMGPAFGDPEDARPYFRATREAFERLAKLSRLGVEARWLSMGMSDSYLVAIEEGANVVRIGTRIFGSRPARL